VRDSCTRKSKPALGETHKQFGYQIIIKGMETTKIAILAFLWRTMNDGKPELGVRSRNVAIAVGNFKPAAVTTAGNKKRQQ
jgi:hypothetical protein